MKKIFLTGILILGLFVGLSADIYLKTKVKTDPINVLGQSIPAKETIIEEWVSDNFYLRKGESISYLLDLRKNNLYLILHRTKSYIETTLPVDFVSLLPPDLLQMSQALQQMTVSVSATGETKVINNIKCQGYKLEMIIMMYPIEMNIWASEELPVDLKTYLERIQPEILKMQFQTSNQVASEFQKIKGLWIAYETKAQIMGGEVNSRAEIVEISKKPAPDGIYALPAGYNRKDRLEMADLQQF